MFRRDSFVEEVELGDIHHASHTSGVREGGYAFGVVCVGSIILFSVYPMVWLPLFAKILTTIVLGVAAGSFFVVWIGGRAKRELQIKAVEQRKLREAETQRQIDEMRAKNSRIPKVER